MQQTSSEKLTALIERTEAACALLETFMAANGVAARAAAATPASWSARLDRIPDPRQRAIFFLKNKALIKESTRLARKQNPNE